MSGGRTAKRRAAEPSPAFDHICTTCGVVAAAGQIRDCPTCKKPVRLLSSNTKLKPAILAVIVLAAITRFMGLEHSPPGFYIDESAHAMNAICLAESGRDAHGTRLPAFSPAIGDFTPPTLLYAEAAWVRVFGSSIKSLRSLAAAFNVLTLFGIFLVGALLFDTQAGLFMALAGAISPWSFQFSRIAWDPPLAPCFTVFGVYFLLKSNAVRDAALGGLFLALAMYAYGPARLEVPLLWVLAIGLARYVRPRSVVWLATGAVTMLVALGPLIFAVLDGRLVSRFQTLSVFQATSSLADAIVLFVRNFLQHVSPRFLFVSGDANLRHATGFSGQWDWLDIFVVGGGAALVIAGVVKRRPLTIGRFEAVLIFLGLAYLTGVVPAALTNEGIPHALRSIQCWPFLAMAVGLILWRLDRLSVRFSYFALILATTFFAANTRDYFASYPSRAAAAFEAPAKQFAQAAAADRRDWNAVRSSVPPNLDLVWRYYAVQYFGKNCASSR